MIKYLKNNIILIFISILLLALGILCILIDGKNVINAFSILALVYLFGVGGWMIFSAFKYRDYLEANNNFMIKPIGYIIQGVILIFLGVLVIFYSDVLVRIIIGILLIILPLITLITEDDKIGYLKRNFWKFIVGLIFILTFDIIIDIIFTIIGIGLIVCVGFIIYLLVKNYKEKEYSNLITKYIVMYIIKKNDKD